MIKPFSFLFADNRATVVVRMVGPCRVRRLHEDGLELEDLFVDFPRGVIGALLTWGIDFEKGKPNTWFAITREGEGIHRYYQVSALCPVAAEGA